VDNAASLAVGDDPNNLQELTFDVVKADDGTGTVTMTSREFRSSFSLDPVTNLPAWAPGNKRYLTLVLVPSSNSGTNVTASAWLANRSRTPSLYAVRQTTTSIPGAPGIVALPKDFIIAFGGVSFMLSMKFVRGGPAGLADVEVPIVPIDDVEVPIESEL